MVTITINGYMTETGKLVFDLPDDLPGDEFELVIKVSRKISQDKITEIPVAIEDDEPPLTDEDIAEMMRPEPKSGAEIIALGHTGGWEHKGITDSVEWVKEQRRKRRERLGW